MIPENEIGVIVLFSQQAHDAGFEIVKMGTAYPDAIVSKEGINYKTEFEYVLSNFIYHKHDIRKCDLIICWKKDIDFPLTVIELSNKDWRTTSIVIPDKKDLDIFYWQSRAKIAETRLKKVKKRKEKKDRVKFENYLEILSETPHISAIQASEKLGVTRQTIYNWQSKDRNGHENKTG